MAIHLPILFSQFVMANYLNTQDALSEKARDKLPQATAVLLQHWERLEHPHKDIVLREGDTLTPDHYPDLVKQVAVLWNDRTTKQELVRYYSGIGSRETPPYVQDRMTQWAMYLEAAGYVLRSGHADGADWAFELGVIDDHMKEIYKPWWTFNGKNKGADGFFCPADDFQNWTEALKILEIVRGDALTMKESHQRLHGRNVYQILGRTLALPSSFVLFWAEATKPGHVRGGTDTAYQLAKHYKIPTFNLNGGPNHSFPPEGLLLGLDVPDEI